MKTTQGHINWIFIEYTNGKRDFTEYSIHSKATSIYYSEARIELHTNKGQAINIDIHMKKKMLIKIGFFLVLFH